MTSRGELFTARRRSAFWKKWWKWASCVQCRSICSSLTRRCKSSSNTEVRISLTLPYASRFLTTRTERSLRPNAIQTKITKIYARKIQMRSYLVADNSSTIPGQMMAFIKTYPAKCKEQIPPFRKTMDRSPAPFPVIKGRWVSALYGTKSTDRT